MSDINKLKKEVKFNKAKMNAAKKRMKAAEKNGSEKQAAICEKQFKTWKQRYLRSLASLNKAKKEAPKKVTLKRALTATGIAVGLAIVGGVVMVLKGSGEGVETESAEAL